MKVRDRMFSAVMAFVLTMGLSPALAPAAESGGVFREAGGGPRLARRSTGFRSGR